MTGDGPEAIRRRSRRQFLGPRQRLARQHETRFEFRLPQREVTLSAPRQTRQGQGLRRDGTAKNEVGVPHTRPAREYITSQAGADSRCIRSVGTPP